MINIRSLQSSAWLLMLAIFILDQASKLWLLFVYELPLKAPVPLLPFMELTMVWNRGISYGLFQQDSLAGQAVLTGVALVASVFLGVWLHRATSRRVAYALALIIGGALGNAVDRVAYGAVFDFVHLHATLFNQFWSWYVFNIADAAIVVGAGILLIDSFWPKNSQQT
jgi:signal peptidase II